VKLQCYWWFKTKYVLFNFDYPPRVVNGASSSGTLRYVSVVPHIIAAPSAATHTAAPPSVAAPSAATHTVVPLPTAAIPNATETSAASTHETVPNRDVATGSTRNNLQDFSETIPQGNLPRPTIPVLEFAATVAHEDLQLSSESAKLPVNSNNDVRMIPTYHVSPIFSVEHGEVHDKDDIDIIADNDDTETSAPKGATVSVTD